MAMSNITVAGITPTLSILGPTQQFIFDQNLSSFQLFNTFVPTALIPSKTNSEFRNNGLSGFRWIHTTQLGDTIGELKLQSFVSASPTGTDIFGVNDSNDIVFYSPISFPGFIVTADINMDSYKIINLADPTDLQDAATKSYVDSIAAGFVFKESCYAASTANLTALYVNGAAGVGATLTNLGTLAAFAIDGVTPPINSRILIKDQTSQFQNGAYSLTTVGSGAIAWVLTRTTDYDTSAEILTGTLFVIKNGTVNDDTIWLQTDIVTTVGTDPISFNQFAYGPSTFLQVNNNLDDLDNATTARLNLGLTDIAIQTVIDHSVLLGNAGDTITSLAVPAVANQILLSGGVATDPSWSTAIYPANTTANQLLYSSGADVITGLMTTNNGILVTNGSGVPSIGSVLPSAVQANITSTGTISSGVWEGTTIAVDSGGTGFETTIPYGVVCGGVTSTGDLQNAGIGTAGQVLSSTGTSSLPIWVSPAGGAPSNATYIVQTADAGLPSAQVLAVLTTGLLKNTTATGVLSTAVAGVDYYAPGFPTTIIDTNGGLNNLFLGTLAGNLTLTGTKNTGVGINALTGVTTGIFNSAFGYQALLNNTTGNTNDAFGYQALLNNISGSNNSAFGYNSLSTNTGGVSNSAFGNSALSDNTTGNGNDAFGRSALTNNTTGSGNSAFGHSALFTNTIGTGNDAFGNQSLYSNDIGIDNSAFGHSSLKNNTGNFNNAFGNQSLFTNTTGINNSAFGNKSLYSNLGGSSNDAFGVESLTNNTTGSENTTVGYQSLFTNTVGNKNAAFGNQSLYGNTVGINNSAFGYQSLYTNNIGTNNSAFGYNSLFSNTTGSTNAAFGYQSLFTNTIGNNNTATGYQSLYSNTASRNNAFGYQSLNTNSGGQDNSAFGYQALFSNTTGNTNDAFGNESLKSNTTGQSNSAFGYQALRTSTTANGNSAFGNQALFGNTTGFSNSAFGAISLYSNNTGSGNNAFGLGSLNANTTGSSNNAFGYQSLYKNSTGNSNDAFGYQALGSITTGTSSNNIAVGYKAGLYVDIDTPSTYNTCTFLGYQATGSVSTLTNAIAIGANVSVSADNTCALGIANTALIVGGGTGVITGVWNGAPVTVPFGGTGLTSTTAYGVVCGGTTSTANLQNAGAGTAAQTLMSNGAGALPTWENRPSASMYFINNVVTTALTGTATKILGTTTLLNVTDFDDDGGVTNRLRYIGAHTINVHVVANVQFTLGNTATTTTFNIFKNGSNITSSRVDVNTSSTFGIENNFAVMNVIVSMAPNDYIGIYASATTNRTLTPHRMTVTAMQAN